MGCEAPKDDVEQIICDVHDAEQQAMIDSAILWVYESSRSERAEIGSSIESSQISIDKVQETTEYIGHEERLFIIEHFWIPADPDGFVEWVKWIQNNLNQVLESEWRELIEEDGVVWPTTLFLIYTRYYIQKYNNPEFPEAQKTRLDIYSQMQDYPDRNVFNSDWDFVRTLSVSSKPNAFDDRRYWWWESFNPQEDNPVDDFRPRQWTMFANWIIDGGFDTTRRREANTIYIEVFQWKHILSLYNENGECELVTYTSPWNASRGANGRYKINAWARTNMHHMSNDLNWAPMPYGINVSDWNIMIHSWAWVVNGDFESAWCYRVALAPGSHIFTRVREMWNFQLIANI